MNLTPDVKAKIESHLNAVRANLAGQEEAVQNEVLEGLRDHINEALARQGGPITVEAVQAVLDGMDDPASYAEEPARTGTGPVAIGRRPANKWLYVALAFLAVNMLGVWKLIQIERKTGASGPNGAGYSAVDVPQVSSGDKAGIRYPNAGNPELPKEGGPPNEATANKSTLRSIAFLDNRNPVLQKPDEELSWLFNEDVVEATELGKPLARGPLKITPEVAGAFQWRTARELVFKPARSWSLNQSYTAELVGEFKTAGGDRYEGSRFWRFSTVSCGLEKFQQLGQKNSFEFLLELALPVTPDSLASKLKLHYLTSDGEKIELERKIVLDGEGRRAWITTPIMPAVSFVCEIEPGLQPKEWSDGTRERIERRVLNSWLLTLSGAEFDLRNREGKTVKLLFSDAVAPETLQQFIEVSPALAVAVSGEHWQPGALNLRGDFVPGTPYEIKVKRGLPSLGGRVLPYTTTRALILAKPADDAAEGGPQPVVPAKSAFDAVVFSPASGMIESGKQELSWSFPCPMVDREQVGRTLKEAPVRLWPDTQGSFFWETGAKLVFRPNTEWPLNRYHEARLSGDLANLAGSRFSGLRFWTFTTPAMAIKEVRQIDAGDGFRFGLQFTTAPHPESLAQKLKVFCYDAAGAKVNLPFTLTNNYSGSINQMVTVASAPSAQIRFALEPGFRPAKWEQGLGEGMEVAAVISTVLRVESVTASEPGERTPAIRIRFSEGVDVKTAAPFVTVEPAVKFTLERESGYNRQNCVRLVGAFEVHREYKVKIKAGLVSERGCLLTKDSDVPVTITRAAATLAFGGAGGYLSPNGTMLVPVKSQNLAKCKVSVAPVMASNLVFFAKRSAHGGSFRLPVPADDDTETTSAGRDEDEDGSDYSYRYGGRSIDDLIGNVSHRELKLAETQNQENTSYVKLGEFTKSKGAYLVQLSGVEESQGNRYRQQILDSRLVVVTDLGLSAKRADSHVFVWVCSLKDAKPVGGVEVAAYSGNNQFIAKALTNADGVAAIPCNSADKNTRPFLVTAQLAEDLSYLALDGAGLQGDSESDTPMRDYRAAGCEAFVFTDRGIFRPGETVHARTIIRQADFTAPQPFPVVFQILKPDGRLFKEMTTLPNAFGAAEVETALPDFLPTGRYTLRVRVPKAKMDLGATSFLLEDFVPPQIRVAVKADRERLAARETLKAEIHAEHLFGAPAAGLKATVKCLYSPVEFVPKQWPGYRFGRDTSDHYGMTEAPKFTMNPQDIDGLVLDAEGMVTAAIGTQVPANAPGPVRAQMQASVFEQSGRSVTATTAAVIDPYPFYIGLKRQESG